MGVPGLWEIINKTGKSRSVAELAVTKGFEDNHNGTRTLRLGIDASIWLHHASFSAGPKGQDRGAHPELRTLFFRLAQLSKLPVSVLFVFDGRQRPKVKRGSKMGKSGTHGLVRGFRELIDLFGMDAREALGEAEAELAYLNRTGSIDAIITDDVDTLVFGARMILKNTSINLTGNKANPATNAKGRPSKHHANVYTAEELERHPDVRLTRGGLVVFALLAGGDYGKGLPGCGENGAHAIARLGYGDNLLQAYENRHIVDLPAYLAQWRLDIQQELRTNSRKLMTRARPSMVVPPDFPPMDQLEMYFDPLTSGRGGGNGGGPPRHRRPLDLPGIAHFCEKQFIEWGYRSRILERFNNFLMEGLVMTVLKAAALEADKREEDRRLRAGAAPGAARVRGLLTPAPHEGVGTSATLVKRCLMPPQQVTRATRNDDRLAHIAAAFVNRGTPEPEEDEQRGDVEEVEDRCPLVVGITRTRQHVSTDMTLEYRVEVCPRQLVEIANSGIQGLHKDPGRRSGDSDDESEDEDDDGDDDEPRAAGKKKRGLNDNKLMWIPASIMRQVHPALVEEYEEKVRSKNSKKSPKKRTAASQPQAMGEAQPQPQPQASSQPARAKPKAKGKGRAKADDYDYLAFNPYASAVSAKEDIDVFMESSLPLRNCGFVFSWPDPDDPDQLVVDSERDDLPTTVNYAEIDAVGVPMATEYANTAPPDRARPRARQSAAASAQSRSKENAPAATQNAPRANAPSQFAKKRKRAAPQPAQAEEPEEPWSEPEDDGRLAFMNPLIDSILGGPVVGGRKEKAKRGRKPRASVPAASASAGPSRSSTQKDKGKGRADVGQASQAANKRRRTTLGRVGTGAGGASAFAQDLGEGPSTGSGRSQNRAGGSTSQGQGHADLFSGLYTLDDLMTSHSRSPSPSWSRPSSPAPPPPSSSMPAPSSSFSAHRPQSPARLLVPARRKSLPSTGDDVIELSSDSDDDVLGGAADLDDDEAFWSSLPGFNGEQSHYSLRKARESQQSLLDTAMNSDAEAEDDAMDQDRDLEELNGLGARKYAYASRSRFAAIDSGSSISAAARRSSGYRNLPNPSSSQESVLDSGEDFFKDVSVVRHLG